MKARWIKYPLKFIRPAKTSRDTLLHKDTWFIILEKEDSVGIGEAGIIPGLSIDDPGKIEMALNTCCENISEYHHSRYDQFPSIQFAIDTALRSIEGTDPFQLFNSPFYRGNSSIKINGLIWMGDKTFILSQIREKLDLGFDCIKLKVGAFDFDTELSVLKQIRDQYTDRDLELRLDANGAFKVGNAMDKLNRLSEFNIHSIEQPIKPGQMNQMTELCINSPIDIALDEELIGKKDSEIDQLLEQIKPQYIVLKPGLLGGFSISNKWVHTAEKHGVNWWATSALESNIGLNAIAQWISSKTFSLPQGLGTGQLYSNNINSPLFLDKDQLSYLPGREWDISKILSWETII